MTSNKQVDHGTYLWTTPHGLRRLVDPTGTHEVCEPDAWRIEHAEELDAAIECAYVALGNARDRVSGPGDPPRRGTA